MIGPAVILRTALAALTAALLWMPATSQAAPPDNRPIAQPNGFVLGAYDPHADFTSDSNSKIEHLFLPWEDVDLTTLPDADNYARQRGRTILITIEPWTWSQKKHIAPKDLRAGIVSGRYDGNIAAICGIVKNFKTPTTIRWAQEMEDTSGRFIWANWNPKDYIAAYRKFVGECRAIAPNVKYMWSPKGNRGLSRYYPGDDVVDEIGLSVFGFQPYDEKVAGHDRFFAELLKPGYEEALKFGKPIYVAELGYRGDEDYVRKWASTVLIKDPQFSKLVAVVYFDDKDVIAWPYNLGVPDWRVTSNIIPKN